MRILGIETSCDETAAAVVEDGAKILSNIVFSSEELQKKYGGILPEQAAREQIKYIIPVIEESLEVLNQELTCLPARQGIKNQGEKVEQIKHGFNKIDAIAVTVGPGLIGSLLVGVETAKTLAYVFHKPLIPVNHLLSHIYANWLIPNSQLPTPTSKPDFPAVCLIVSGGHTLLTLMKGHGEFQLLGETRDDAAGEAFDKIARLLGLSYPGGPAIEKAAEQGNPKAFPFPRPMIDSENFDFSFSGLKTAVLREIQELRIKNNELSIEIINNLAASAQEAIVDVLVEKTVRAAKEYNVKSIIIGGGVAANTRLKQKFQIGSPLGDFKFQIFIPPPSLCTDNAAVIASAAFFHNHPSLWQKMVAHPNLLFPHQIS